MIDVETRARIRRLFYVEHWKIGTIARELGLHPETVSLAVETDRFNNTKTLRPSVTDPYADFIREILAKHPHLRATRIFQMIRDRGYRGSIVQLRRCVACIRPAHREAFLRLRTFPGEQGQVDWAHFGEVSVGRAALMSVGKTNRVREIQLLASTQKIKGLVLRRERPVHVAGARARTVDAVDADQRFECCLRAVRDVNLRPIFEEDD